MMSERWWIRKDVTLWRHFEACVLGQYLTYAFKKQGHHKKQEGGCKEIQELLGQDNFEFMMSEHCEDRRALRGIRKG